MRDMAAAQVKRSAVRAILGAIFYPIRIAIHLAYGAVTILTDAPRYANAPGHRPRSSRQELQINGGAVLWCFVPSIASNFGAPTILVCALAVVAVILIGRRLRYADPQTQTRITVPAFWQRPALIVPIALAFSVALLPILTATRGGLLADLIPNTWWWLPAAAIGVGGACYSVALFISARHAGRGRARASEVAAMLRVACGVSDAEVAEALKFKAGSWILSPAPAVALARLADPAGVDAAVASIMPRYEIALSGRDLIVQEASLETADRRAQMAASEGLVIGQERDGDVLSMVLAAGTSPTMAERVQAYARTILGADTALVEWEPYESRAVARVLSQDEQQVRQRLAQVLKIRFAWELAADVTSVADRIDQIVLRRLPPGLGGISRSDRLAFWADVALSLPGGNNGWAVEESSDGTVTLTWGEPRQLPGLVPLAEMLPVDLAPDAWATIPVGRGETGESVGFDLGLGPHALTVGPTGSGKLLPLDAPIPVPGGWATMGDLRVGDEVLGLDGQPTEVVFVSETNPNPELFRITLDDGQTIDACADHRWLVSDANIRHEIQTPKRQRALRTFADKQRITAELRALGERFEPGDYRTVGEILAFAQTVDAAATENRVKRVAGDSRVLRKQRAAFVQHRMPAREMTLSNGRAVHQPAHVRMVPSNEMLLDTRDALLAMSDDLVLWKQHEVAIQQRPAPVTEHERVMTTREMVNAGLFKATGGARFAIRTTEPLDLPEADLLVTPYSFGAWLGDGTSRTGAVTSMDIEIIDRIVSDGYAIRRGEHPAGNRASTYFFDEMTEQLRAIGALKNKHIPANYLRASKTQRLALLQGLMDSDGHVDVNGSCELALSDERLAADALELIRSLGIKASMRRAGAGYTSKSGVYVTCRDRFRIHFTTTQRVVSITRKADRLPSEVRETSEYLYVKGIAPIESRPGRCIQVANAEHVYLCAGMVPTHNTVALVAELAQRLVRGHRIAIIDPTKGGVDFAAFERFSAGFARTFEDSVDLVKAAYAEGQRRKQLLLAHGEVKWSDLPLEVQTAENVTPLTVVIDEVGSLLVEPEIPKSLAKDDPERLELEVLAGQKALIKLYIGKIARELRFVGVFLDLATQRPDASILGGELRSNLTSTAQLAKPGSPPTLDAIRMVFPGDSAQEAYDALRALDDGQSRGLGVIAGDGGGVAGVRVAYAPMREVVELLTERGVPHGSPLRSAEQLVAREAAAGRPAFGQIIEAAEEEIDLGEMDFGDLDLGVFTTASPGELPPVPAAAPARFDTPGNTAPAAQPQQPPAIHSNRPTFDDLFG